MEKNKETTECKSCKSKNPLKRPNGMMLIGFYVLLATCYGTITFIKDIISILFK